MNSCLLSTRKVCKPIFSHNNSNSGQTPILTASKNLKDRRDLMLRNMNAIESSKGKSHHPFKFVMHPPIYSVMHSARFFDFSCSNLNIVAHNYGNINEEDLFKTSITPLQQVNCSSEVFSSPKKKDFKHRKRKVDAERHANQKKINAIDKKSTREKSDIVKPYDGKLIFLNVSRPTNKNS